jgi:hypothetical protein
LEARQRNTKQPKRQAAQQRPRGKNAAGTPGPKHKQTQAQTKAQERATSNKQQRGKNARATKEGTARPENNEPPAPKPSNRSNPEERERETEETGNGTEPKRTNKETEKEKKGRIRTSPWFELSLSTHETVQREGQERREVANGPTASGGTRC